jgi:ectoine hydroxylase-related dioxygenase (phytanoyl-CoA dioxygenase family)
VSRVFEALIETERAAGQSAGDHFAAPGTNARVWNALEKLCVADPEGFALYYSNDMIALAAKAWLGPKYQLTSQVNVVYPGGQAQAAHRDYHLGFMDPTECATYPPHVHQLSSRLTLQGAVAHCDMPVASGPTKLLPFSQLYAAGYLACHRDDFRQYFDRHSVQLELRKGDAVFFNPALFHAAGSNQSADIGRMANLLQISSAFGRAMERVNRRRISVLLFQAISRLRAGQRLSRQEEDAAIAACAEGYAFPTDLDLHPPLYGRAPEDAQSLFRKALDESWSDARFASAIEQVSGDT